MLRNAVQTSPLSLFNAASSSAPLALFSCSTDVELCEDSGVALLASDQHDAKVVWHLNTKRTDSKHEDDDDDEDGDDNNRADDDVAVVRRTNHGIMHMRGHTKLSPSSRTAVQGHVLHMQSPTLDTTFIRAPPAVRPASLSTVKTILGLRLSVMHIRFRLLDGAHRPFMFEVGVRDHDNHLARLRWSTFCMQPTLLASSSSPLLHMPLRCPPDANRDPFVLTPWNTVSVALHDVVAQLNSLPLAVDNSKDADERPSHLTSFGAYHSVDYVQVHANCRLQRIWFTDKSAAPTAVIM